MATEPRPIGWDPRRTHTGMAADHARIVWLTCTTCGRGRAPHQSARNGEGLVPVACRHCHVGVRRCGEAA